MNSVKTVLEEKLKKVVEGLGGVDVPVVLTRPTAKNHGDYTTNIAMTLAKKLGKNPRELVEEIISILNTKYKILNTIDSASVEGPGFINFRVTKDTLITEVEALLSGASSANVSDLRAKQVVMLEFTDPNPFKEFHIGHLLNITLGEAFARSLEAVGATVIRANYEGDVGMHVAKALFGMEALKAEMPQDNATSLEKVRFLGRAYAFGAKAFEDDPDSTTKIRSINIKIYQEDESIKELWSKGRAWSLEHFEEIYRRVGTVYKHYYFESAIVALAKNIAELAVQKGIFEKSQGAVVFKGEHYGLHTRVFLTAEGNPTYEGKEMALAEMKAKDEVVDASYIMTAREQAEYFKVVLKALSFINPDVAAKTMHFSFGFVRLKDGKMSSRLGNIIPGMWLLDEAKKQIRETYKEMNEDTAEKVALAAVKYSFLKFARGSDISFDFHESISLEGNSGPYLQYTTVRTQSILKKYEAKYGIFRFEKSILTAKNNWNTEEQALLQLLTQFRENVEIASQTFMPNVLCNYLFELAQTFNTFYQKHKVIRGVIPVKTGIQGALDPLVKPEDDKEELSMKTAEFRMALVLAVGKTLKKGLFILGIETPEKM
jgi:arginyl-tRNA synthetase